VERNRISSLQSHGKALEKQCCLPGVFCDSGDMPANLLCELSGHLTPCTSCFYGKWVLFIYLFIIIINGREHKFTSAIIITCRPILISRDIQTSRLGLGLYTSPARAALKLSCLTSSINTRHDCLLSIWWLPAPQSNLAKVALNPRQKVGTHIWYDVPRVAKCLHHSRTSIRSAMFA